MEDKRVVISALGVGFGVGVGLGLGLAATGRTRSFDEKCASRERSGSAQELREIIELELRKRIIDGKQSNITLDRFPYYLSDQTRVLLTSAAFLYLKQEIFIKHAQNLSPASRAILLSGPAEPYHQMLAKALAHYFEARLLLLDVTDFNLKNIKPMEWKSYGEWKHEEQPIDILASTLWSQVEVMVSGRVYTYKSLS